MPSPKSFNTHRPPLSHDINVQPMGVSHDTPVKSVRTLLFSDTVTDISATYLVCTDTRNWSCPTAHSYHHFDILLLIVAGKDRSCHTVLHH